VRRLLEDGIVVTKILLALFMQGNHGKPIRKNRPSHGLVFNFGCSATYSFDDGRVLTCRCGECIYLPKGSNYTAVRYDIEKSKDSGVYAINFLTLSELNENRPFVLPIKGKDEMRSLFFKAAASWKKKDAGYMEECFSDLYRIVKQMRKETERYTPKEKTFERIAPALKYIEENYLSESIPVAHLAFLCHISEAYLRKKFHDLFSVSPAVYMRNKRINYAKELLQSEEYSVTDVSMLSGFNDPAYFVREFKKTVGVTPSAYRKEL
jgi:AraC-like DNA-binding protein